MPIKGEEKRAHNRAALATPEGRNANAERQRKHRHKQGIERHQIVKAETYFRFRLRNGTSLPALITNCTPEQLAQAEANVRSQMAGPVEVEVREVVSRER